MTTPLSPEEVNTVDDERSNCDTFKKNKYIFTLNKKARLRRAFLCQ